MNVVAENYLLVVVVDWFAWVLSKSRLLMPGSVKQFLSGYIHSLFIQPSFPSDVPNITVQHCFRYNGKQGIDALGSEQRDRTQSSE